MRKLIGEYQRSAIFVEFPWARYVRGDNSAISESAKAGAVLFFSDVDEGGAQCVQCHSGDFYTDEKHHVIGFPQVGPGPGDPDDRDFGRARQSGLDAQRFAFRTPNLLNVELTAPYGHAGAYADPGTTFSHYAIPQFSIPFMVDFLHTLTDPCLLDRACFARWIPTPEEAPDGLQLNAVDRDGNPL